MMKRIVAATLGCLMLAPIAFAQGTNDGFKYVGGEAGWAYVGTAGERSQSQPVSAPSWSRGGQERLIPLKDGTTLVVFKDGKMAMRDDRGRPMSMKENHPMETGDGKLIMMRGNELWRKTTSEKELEDLYRGG